MDKITHNEWVLANEFGWIYEFTVQLPSLMGTRRGNKGV